MTGPDPITVLLADDQALMRSGLRMILDRVDGITVVGEAADGATAIDLARDHRPDVVLMDIRMPGTDGIEATQRITTAPHSTTRILVLTTYDLDEYLYRAIHAGASGFLLKTAPPAQLTAAIRSVVAGDVLLAPEITRRLLELHIRRPPPGQPLPSPLAELTERELDVLRLVAKGHSNTEIREKLYLSTPTVKTHINRLFRKLAVRDRVQAVVLAYETGLVAPGDTP
jgi:DNA-binding NarL/FixJ family response regulator